MRKFALLTMSLIALCIMPGCGPIIISEIYDHYVEYKFVLPFDHSVSNYAGNVYFDTDYSMEQMVELISEAGYNASLHRIDNIKTILISAQKDGFTYYFILCDKNYNDNGTSYILMSARATIYFENDDASSIGGRELACDFLAPLHILELRDRPDKWRLFGSFEDVAGFYRATGRDDVEIDDINKTVLFRCESYPNLGISERTIIIQYAATETGNYLKIRPLPTDLT
ncbi:MAG: hypothetical protein FWE97_03000 [Dehalococcoidia bacterium]|nr:hypothetical protein [Dehalococcoidia bacterium]